MKVLLVAALLGFTLCDARPSSYEMQDLKEELLRLLTHKVVEPICKIADPLDLNVDSSDAPNALEINECTEKLAASKKECADFDVSRCGEDCLLGYETNGDGCVISCNCKTEGLFDGDVMMTAEDVASYTGASDKAASRWLRRWDNNQQADGTYSVPYVLDSSIHSNPRASAAIAAAIGAYSEETCLRFKPRTIERDYLYFYQGPGCWSYIGRRFGKQQVSIGRGCEWKGIAMHEMMHAMGFYHEQSRPDRDEFVEIKFENVRRGREGNFRKQPPSSIDSMGSPYDFGSVMHYGGYSFTKNRQPTILSRKTGLPVKSQRQGFSEEDAKQLNSMYKCKPKARSETNELE